MGIYKKIILVLTGVISLLVIGTVKDNLFAQGLLLKEDFNSGTLTTPGAFERAIKCVDDDNGGKCIDTSMTDIYFPMKYFNRYHGTIEFRIKYIVDPISIKTNINLIKVRGHLNELDAYLNGFNVISGWGAGLFIIIADKERRNMLKYAGISQWKTDEWYHIAFTWEIDKFGKADIAMYVDYEVVDKIETVIQFDEALWRKVESENPANWGEWQKYGIAVGNFYSEKSPTPVCIDDLTIYDFARSYEKK